MKICIDAGHCTTGGDAGAKGHGLLEQDITWLIADKLRFLLESAGETVVMTRKFKEHLLGNTEEESLDRRSRICNEAGCDRLMSIHCNSHDNEQANGTEVLVYGFGGKAEELARHIQSEITCKLETADRGVKKQNCSVLRKTKCPAVLIETAFISNEQNSLLLRYRHDDFAQAIFDAYCKCEGIQKPERHSYDDTVNQMILDGVTSIENMQYWERTLAEVPKEVRTIIERYQKRK